MKIIKMVTIIQVFMWLLFLLGDYLSETFSRDALFVVTNAFLPPIIPVVYLVFQKKIHYDSIPGWVNVLTVLAVWFTETLIFGILVASLELIPQAQDGWDNLLNGIEYSIFPLYNIIAFPIIVLLWNLVVWIYKKLQPQ